MITEWTFYEEMLIYRVTAVPSGRGMRLSLEMREIVRASAPIILPPLPPPPDPGPAPDLGYIDPQLDPVAACFEGGGERKLRMRSPSTSLAGVAALRRRRAICGWRYSRRRMISNGWSCGCSTVRTEEIGRAAQVVHTANAARLDATSDILAGRSGRAVERRVQAGFVDRSRAAIIRLSEAEAAATGARSEAEAAATTARNEAATAVAGCRVASEAVELSRERVFEASSREQLRLREGLLAKNLETMRQSLLACPRIGGAGETTSPSPQR